MAEHKPRDSNTAIKVIVDFIFADGLFFVAVENIGERPAYRVAIKFDHPIIGLPEGSVISDLPLFQNIEFLAPHKKITTLVDTSTAYFRNNPARISAVISYNDDKRKRHRITIAHDLSIYKDIVYIPKLAAVPNETR